MFRASGEVGNPSQVPAHTSAADVYMTKKQHCTNVTTVEKISQQSGPSARQKLAPSKPPPRAVLAKAPESNVQLRLTSRPSPTLQTHAHCRIALGGMLLVSKFQSNWLSTGGTAFVFLARGGQPILTCILPGWLKALSLVNSKWIITLTAVSGSLLRVYCFASPGTSIELLKS